MDRRPALAAALVAACTLLLPAAAHAQSITATAANDPVESVTTQIGVSGTASNTSSRVSLKVKPSGGTACAANPEADNGSTVMSFRGVSQGPFNQSENWVFETAGSYVLCAWLTDGNQVLAAHNRTVSVRVPKLSLSVAVPQTAAMNETFQVSTTAQTEASRSLHLSRIPDTGRGCPANADAADSTSGEFTIISGRRMSGGPRTESENNSISDPGTYLFCGYLHYKSTTDPPQATASATITIPAPPPPCIVPTVAPGTDLAAATGALGAANCTRGKIKRIASTRYARGTVVKVIGQAGASLANAAPVDVLVSLGAPCVVPRKVIGMRLGAARLELVRRGCTVGSTSRRRHRFIRRGRVVAASVPLSVKQKPRAVVNLVVSSGRRR